MMPVAIEHIGDVLVVALAGKSLDASNVKEFKQEIAPILASKAKVVFDMSQLQFVDSSGLGSLLSCLRQLQAGGGELKLCGLAQPVQTLFTLVRMNRIFDIFPTKAGAVSALQGLGGQ
jgi:anti-sigma B factor antagonist